MKTESPTIGEDTDPNTKDNSDHILHFNRRGGGWPDVLLVYGSLFSCVAVILLFAVCTLRAHYRRKRRKAQPGWVSPSRRISQVMRRMVIRYPGEGSSPTASSSSFSWGGAPGGVVTEDFYVQT